MIPLTLPWLQPWLGLQQQQEKLTEHQREWIKKLPLHIIIKTLIIQNKERILRSTKEKLQVTYEGRPIRITSDFSMETVKATSSLGETLRDHRCPGYYIQHSFQSL